MNSLNPQRPASVLNDTTRIVKETFFDLTLSLQAIFIIHNVNSDIAQDIINNLEEIYINTMTHLRDLKPEHKHEDVSPQPYPVIERFLCRLENEI